MVTTLEEKKRLQKSSNVKFLIGLGLVGGYVAGAASTRGPGAGDVLPLLFLGLGLLGSVAVLLALMDYMKSKGYSAVYGLLGLFGLPGWLIIAVLPDKNKPVPSAAQDGHYPRTGQLY